MARKRLLYNSPQELLDELITGKRSIKNAFTLRYRALYLYEDTQQFEIIDQAIRLFQASLKISDFDL